MGLGDKGSKAEPEFNVLMSIWVYAGVMVPFFWYGKFGTYGTVHLVHGTVHLVHVFGTVFLARYVWYIRYGTFFICVFIGGSGVVGAVWCIDIQLAHPFTARMHRTHRTLAPHPPHPCTGPYPPHPWTAPTAPMHRTHRINIPPSHRPLFAPPRSGHYREP